MYVYDLCSVENIIWVQIVQFWFNSDPFFYERLRERVLNIITVFEQNSAWLSSKMGGILTSEAKNGVFVAWRDLVAGGRRPGENFSRAKKR